MDQNKTDQSDVESRDQYEKNYAMGMWKFNDKISIKELTEVAKRWATEDPDYLQLYVRKCSKDQYGVGFTYKLKEEKSGSGQHDEYFRQTSDFLKRKFGNDLVGWDLGSPVWIIK